MGVSAVPSWYNLSISLTKRWEGREQKEGESHAVVTSDDLESTATVRIGYARLCCLASSLSPWELRRDQLKLTRDTTINHRQGRQLWTYRVTNCFRRQLHSIILNYIRQWSCFRVRNLHLAQFWLLWFSVLLVGGP